MGTHGNAPTRSDSSLCTGGFFELQETRDRERRQDPTGLLITLDELHYAHMQDIVEFGTTIQHMVRDGREIAVAMAGIPSAVKPLLAANEGRTQLRFCAARTA
ncbi:hypothetical protein [Corynebacterium aquatimens]|uniref:hypothetical protein n=1 Tax=Corynebacterium aquatimens TaxID=1190508 RepID=UPI0033142985